MAPDNTPVTSDAPVVVIGAGPAGLTAAYELVKRGDKVVNFKKKRRKGYERKVGHRQELTVVTVKSIA